MSRVLPGTMRVFEGLVLLTLALRAAQIVVNPEPWLYRIAAADRLTAPGVGMVLVALGPLVPAALGLWTSRRASRVTRFIFVVWVALLLAAYVLPILQYGFVFSVSAAFNITILLAYVGAVVLLFTPSSVQWFRRERSIAEIAEDFA